jgi:hypothetical protein
MDRDGPFSKPVDRSRAVRAALNELNEYVRRNPELHEEKDPGWKEYLSDLGKLRQRGKALHNALFLENDLRSRAFSEKLQHLTPGAELTAHCTDDEVTLPLGFVFDCEAAPLQGSPSRAEFTGFWLDRFNITMLVAGSGCEHNILSVDPKLFTTLYALDENEINNADDYFHRNRQGPGMDRRTQAWSHWLRRRDRQA